jgi:hypothetical protein
LDWLLTTLSIYRRVVGRGAMLAMRNWPIAGAALFYGLVLAAASMVTMGIGLLGGFAMPLAVAFCGGSFLFCVEAIVRSGKVTLEDFRASLGAYFVDVLGVMFALWIFSLVGSLLSQSPYYLVITVFSSLLIWVFFNAVPELIYLGHHSTMELLGESYRFILQNWIEWFPLNIVLGFAVPAVWNLPGGGFAMNVARILIGALLVYFVMVVRGLLFLELADSSRRSRLFRYRAGN